MPSITPNFRDRDATEGRTARAIEKRTESLPSDMFLWAAGGSIAVSMVMHLMGHKQESQFIGQWAPTFLILGLYNKLVKVAGHEGGDGHRQAQRM